MTFDELEKLIGEFHNLCNATVERRGIDRIWTPEIQQFRAKVHAAAFQILNRMDPRFGSILDTGIAPRLVELLFSKVGSSLSLSTPDEVSFGWWWASNGMPTFHLTAGLMANLLLTDPGKVSEADVPWPFPAFCVRLPDPGCPIQFMWSDKNELVKLTDFYVLSWMASKSPYRKQKQIYLGQIVDAHTDQEFSRGLSRVIDDVLKEIDGSGTQRALLTRGYAASGISVFKNELWEGDEHPVSNWFDGPFARYTNEQLGADKPLEDVDLAAIAAIQRIAVNLALYLSSHHEDSGDPVWASNMKSQGKNARNWTIGQSVKIGPEVREAATKVAAGYPASSPTVRHIVRGHFRNQVCGRGRQDRKRIYIKPFWRGPTDGPVVDREYKVK